MKYIRVVLKGEPRMWFDHPIPQGMTFANLVMIIRSAGYFVTTNVYAPHDSIHHMMEIELGAPPPSPVSSMMQ